MYKNYIPELPEKYNEINEKLGNKELRQENENRLNLYSELFLFLSEEREKMVDQYPTPGDVGAETFFGYPVEEITIERISDFWPYVAEDYSQEQLKAIKIGHLYLLDNTYRKPGCSYYNTNLSASQIKDIVLNNKITIDPCLIKYGYNQDDMGCANIAKYKLEVDLDNSYFISNWS